MVSKLLSENRKNKIAAIVFLLAMMFIISIGFDYYYDLNDDVVMKDILSGAYTGTPDGHNIQMLYPVSLLISFCYKIVRSVPWYGIFLCACHYGCFYLIANRSLCFAKTMRAKVSMLMAQGFLIFGFFLWELVFAQYTVTCTLLAATAVFLFYTTKDGLCPKDFLKENIVGIILVMLAFYIRTEMLLLVMPFICLAGILKWSKEKCIFCKESFQKYLLVFGCMLCTMAVGYGVNTAAYHDSEWQEFYEFFDNRTTIYDYLGVPDYKEHKAFYDNAEISESEWMLFDNYNFGLSEEIDAYFLADMITYSKENITAAVPVVQRIKTAAYDYYYRTTHATDFPFNVLVLAAYVGVIALAIKQKDKTYIWKIPLFFAVRSVSWFYIQYGQRAPIRITHSLYLIEFLLLCACILTACVKEKHTVKKIYMAAFLCFGLIFIPFSVKNVFDESKRREAVNAEMQALGEYTSEQADSFYFLDVFSSVKYSEKMFRQVDNEIANIDIMGGWANKSPLTKEKLSHFGIATTEEALLTRDNVYFVSYADKPTEWLESYFLEEAFENVVVEKQDEITVNGQEVFAVYHIERY